VFVLFLIFLAVLLARRFGGPARQRIAAGLSIFGAADVPLKVAVARFVPALLHRWPRWVPVLAVAL
jgi:hypothetical protein